MVLARAGALRIPSSTGCILALVLAGCNARPPTAPTPIGWDYAKLKIVAPLAVLVPGESVQLQAMKYTNEGSADVTRTVAWGSSDTSVTTVSASGSVLAVSPGNAEVSAATEGLVAGIAVRVVSARVRSSGQIDPELASDIIAHNQDIAYNKHRGTITRFDLPIRVFVDPSFDDMYQGECAARAAVEAWRALTGLPIEFIGKDVEPRIRMTVMPTADSRARVVTDSVNLDNSLRGQSVIMPPWGVSCHPVVLRTITHEVGHALGLMGHPNWDGVMAYYPPGVSGPDHPNEREARFLIELYKLPHGASVRLDGTWVVEQ